MSSVINKNEDKWLRPWNIKEFDDLYNRDERFFGILIKGLLGYLTKNIVMYDKPVKHYIISTGSSYMYVESNGYEYNLQEVSGEDWMYSELPRCVVDIDSLNIPMEELSQSYSRGNYERKTKDNVIQGYNAEMKRMPIEMTFNLHYVFGTFNESIVVLQEILEKIIFQKYFKIAYLGQIINCSVEFPNNGQIQFNKPDFSSFEKNQKQLDLSVIVCANYPVINENSSIEMWKQIKTFAGYLDDINSSSDIIIEIDGIVSTHDEVYIDLSKYDLNNDGLIDENEITTIEQFIDICDVDNDGIVTSKDINVIVEIFMNNEYNINFDILHIGSFDMKNLITIKKLFNLLDINNDNSVSREEIKELTTIINKVNKIKLNNQLTIGYEDLMNIIKYVRENDKLSFVTLIKNFNNYLNIHIKSEHIQLYNIIIELLRDGKYDNIKIEINNYYNENISIEIYNQLIIFVNQIIEFKKYDLNEDNVIDKNDIDVFINILNEITNKNITYYSASRIYLHNNGDVHNANTITDIEEYKFDDKQEG